MRGKTEKEKGDNYADKTIKNIINGMLRKEKIDEVLDSGLGESLKHKYK